MQANNGAIHTYFFTHIQQGLSDIQAPSCALNLAINPNSSGADTKYSISISPSCSCILTNSPALNESIKALTDKYNYVQPYEQTQEKITLNGIENEELQQIIKICEQHREQEISNIFTIMNNTQSNQYSERPNELLRY